MTRIKAILLIIFIAPLQANEPISVKSSAQRTAIVELYTSEGCSSCPPADRWLNQLIKIPQDELDVLALALHVNYWDYIGWKDEFASPAYTDRQRKLARINRQRSIYTPEFFVDGIEARGTASVLEKIRMANQTPSEVELELVIESSPSNYQLHLNSLKPLIQKLEVQFVVFEDSLSSDVKSGENAGRKLHHQRVVRYLSPPQSLQPEMKHSITIRPEWNKNNIGIGALVKSSQQPYMQAVYTLLNPSSKR